MQPIACLLLPAALLALPTLALADHDDHDGHRRGSYKQEYWDGACKVERKWKKNGEFKEERKCRPQPAYVVQQPAVVVQQPAVVYAPAPVVVAPSPGVVIQGTIRLP